MAELIQAIVDNQGPRRLVIEPACGGGPYCDGLLQLLGREQALAFTRALACNVHLKEFTLRCCESWRLVQALEQSFQSNKGLPTFDLWFRVMARVAARTDIIASVSNILPCEWST